MNVVVREENVEPAWYVVRNDEESRKYREQWMNIMESLMQDGGHAYPKMIPLPPGASLQFVRTDEDKEWPEGEGEGAKWCKEKVGDETGWVPEWSVGLGFKQCVIKGPYYTPVP